EAGIRVVQTPYAAPNANAYAERFVRSMKEECLDRIIPIGDGHFRRAVMEFIAHYHRERNHQGLENGLIEGAPVSGVGRVHRQSWLGGLLNYYRRAAGSTGHVPPHRGGRKGLQGSAVPPAVGWTPPLLDGG